MPAVVVKKEEKVAAVFAAMSNVDDLQEFKTKFKEMFPKEWKHIISVYQKEEREDVKHKGHPMPEPEKYLENTYKTARAKQI
ncbi:MAG: hypothetical protein BWY37_00841 [Firmicutes bacterium ADurb.Bin262]|nr:MAG: hypothetical protein BWY37_00841 [Firmicutes bacterium ADurb.Bin262]